MSNKMNTQRNLFLRNFNEDHIKEKKFLESEVIIVKEESYNLGILKGIESTDIEIVKHQESMQKELLFRLNTGIDQLVESQQDILEQLQALISSLTLALFRKVFTQFEKQHSIVEVEEFISAQLSSIAKMPQLNIYVHPDYVNKIKEVCSIHPRVKTLGLSVQVEPNINFELTDSQIEWESGYIEKNISDLIQEFQKLTTNITEN